MNVPSEVVDTTGQSKQTWLDYYLAVKKGDLKSVVKAADKDFRIGLTMNKSALEIAALYGHKNLVEYFLERAEEKQDLMLVVGALKDALRGCHLDLAKLVMDYLDRVGMASWVQEEHMDKIICAAINGKSLDCLKFVWDFAVNKDLSLYTKAAFSTGSFELLRFIRENGDLPDHPTPLFMILPESARDAHFYTNGGEFSLPMVFIAFKEYEKLQQYYQETGWNVQVDGPIDTRERYVIKTTDRESEEPWRLLDVAAFYGHLDLVKREIDALRSSDASSLDDRLQSAFKFSLRNNHVHILDYLISENLVKPRPPYEYEGFNMNEAFFFVRERTSDIEMTEISDFLKKNLQERIRVMCSFEDNRSGAKYAPSDHRMLCVNLSEDRSALRLTKIEEYYEYLLNSCGENVKKLELADLYVEALSEQNVDAALCFKKRIGDNCCIASEATHLQRMMMETAMGGYEDLGCITSPVVVELLLGNKPCRAQHAVERLPHFLKPARLFHLDGRLLTIHNVVLDTYERFNYHPLDLYVKRAEAVLAVLFFGVTKPRTDVLAKFNFISTFSCTRSNGLRECAGKVLALMNCTKLGDDDLDLRHATKWLTVPWTCRVTFLAEFFIGLSRIRWRNRLRMSGLLVYMLHSKSEDFTRHFLNLLEISGIDVEDELYTSANAYAIIPSEKRQKFDAALASLKERVPSLMECARHAIHFYYLSVAHEARVYVTVGTLVERAAFDLPKHLQQFLQFDDVHRNIEFVLEGHVL